MHHPPTSTMNNRSNSSTLIRVTDAKQCKVPGKVCDRIKKKLRGVTSTCCYTQPYASSCTLEHISISSNIQTLHIVLDTTSFPARGPHSGNARSSTSLAECCFLVDQHSTPGRNTATDHTLSTTNTHSILKCTSSSCQFTCVGSVYSYARQTVSKSFLQYGPIANTSWVAPNFGPPSLVAQRSPFGVFSLLVIVALAASAFRWTCSLWYHSFDRLSQGFVSEYEFRLRLRVERGKLPRP